MEILSPYTLIILWLGRHLAETAIPRQPAIICWLFQVPTYKLSKKP